MTIQKLIEMFGPYKKPTEITIPKFKAVEEKVMELATLINDIAPESTEKEEALIALRASRMWANAAISIHS